MSKTHTSARTVFCEIIIKTLDNYLSISAEDEFSAGELYDEQTEAFRSINI